MVWKKHGKSLIKPNQYRKFGIKIYDGPTDPHIKLVIEAPEDLLIPIAMERSTCGLIKHPPTDYDLHDNQWILLSDEFDWDPSNNLFEIYLM